MPVRKNPPARETRGTMNISNNKVFEAVQRRAYELYCRRGCKHGYDVTDWIEAEKQVKAELGLRR